MARLTFDQVNVVVADLDRTLGFYRRLGVEAAETSWPNERGLRHAPAAVGDGIDFAFDNAAFAQVWNGGWSGRADLAGRVVIGFRMEGREAVDALYSQMTASGARGLQAPYDAFWGARYAILEDPDGVAVGLMSPVDPARRTAPP